MDVPPAQCLDTRQAIEAMARKAEGGHAGMSKDEHEEIPVGRAPNGISVTP